MSLLEVHEMSKLYGELAALDGVSLKVQAGEFHGLIGPNGSGKSTLLKCIVGAETPDKGAVRFMDKDITGATPADRARAGLSLKFQITNVLPSLTVYDNVLLAFQANDTIWRLIRSRSRRALHHPVMDLLERSHLDPRAGDPAGELSHGEQQWLEIAMALASGPKLLLLDEPTAGMSPEERRRTGELLASIRENCSLLIVEHDIDFIKVICDVITVLDQGRLLDEGTVEEIEASERVQEVYVSRV
jgi:branched-chain amino acid transport system ATP-binding protein/urea transport system ATP-binding protein